jgi:hypothetical protein
MQDDVQEYYLRMLKAKEIPAPLEETYNQAKMFSDRLDGGPFNAKELAIIAVVSGCDPFAGGVEPPRNMDFVSTVVPETDPWSEGAPCEVDWNGPKTGTFIAMDGDKIQVKLDADPEGAVRTFRPSRVKMLERA